VVKDYVRLCRARGRETFVPLAHPPGHGQVDFGEAVAVIGGVRQKLHFFGMDLPQSDAPFVKAYPRETTEAFLDGHVSSFAFFGGVPLSLLYDNLKIAVARICGDGKRERNRAFTELLSHYLFIDRFGRPGKGNDKGKVEGLVIRIAVASLGDASTDLWDRLPRGFRIGPWRRAPRRSI
jgi:transposase